MNREKKNLLISMLHILFPPICHSCDQKANMRPYLFCQSCIELLQLNEITSKEKNEAAVFEKSEIATKFIHLLNRYPRLIKTAAAYLVCQFEKLGWPMPDGVYPFSKSYFSINRYLAKEVGSLLNRPVTKNKNRVLYVEMFLKKDPQPMPQNRYLIYFEDLRL